MTMESGEDRSCDCLQNCFLEMPVVNLQVLKAT